jgi:hypothetical protein
VRLGVLLAALATGLLATTWAAQGRAEGATLDAATAEQSLAAQKAFKEADAEYDARRFDEALEGYRASYDVVKSPNTRLMIARSLRELGRLEEAHAEAKATLAEAEAVSERHSRYVKTAEAARANLKALATSLGFVKIDLGETGDDALVVKVGDRSIDSTQLKEPIAIAPGTITIVVTAPGQKTYRRQVTVEAGSTQTVSVELEVTAVRGESATPAEVTAGVGADTSMRTWAYVAGGVGAAGLLTFGTFGVLSHSSYSSLEEDCPNGRCPPGRNDEIDAGRRYQLIANVGLGVGLVGVAAGTTLFLLGSKEREQPQAAVRITPAGVSIEKRF